MVQTDAMSAKDDATDDVNHAHQALNSPSERPQPILFGNWSFNADSGDLCDGETTTRLEPQVAKLLNHFLTHQHKVISREALIAAVWDNRTVSDDAINRCVSILRHILSPQDKHAYIETVVRKGYIAHFPASADMKSAVEQPGRRRKYLFLAALVSVAAIILYLIAGNVGDPNMELREPASSGPPMVAVLPFTSTSQGSDGEFFANGVHDDLLTQLAKLQSMRVISSTSVMEYEGVARNLRKIGEELGADVILEGSVQIAGNRIRINAQLIDTRTDEHLWAETYDRELSPANIFDVQSEIARTITAELNTTLTAQDREQLALIPTKNMAAYRAYHRAMQIRESGSSGVSDPEYLQALEEAVELDPEFSRAWAELVSNLALLNFSGDMPDMTVRAESALQHLQAIAPGSADHLMGQAAYLYYALKDYNRAHDVISRALTMNPSNARAVHLKSWIERRQGDFEAHLASKREALNLDPRNPVFQGIVVSALLIMHRYDEARSEIESSQLGGFYTSSARVFLQFREDRDLDRLQASMLELCPIYNKADCGWDAHIANRDYQQALASLSPSGNEVEPPLITVEDRRRIYTHWLMKDDERIAQELPQWLAQLEKDRTDSGSFYRPQSYLSQALLYGIEGNAEEAERLIKRWFRLQPIDWAEKSVVQHEACRILGMIGATQAAVQCIRRGIVETSYVTPFFEPYLPFYDALRGEPEFIQMLADIDGPEH